MSFSPLDPLGMADRVARRQEEYRAQQIFSATCGQQTFSARLDRTLTCELLPDHDEKMHRDGDIKWIGGPDSRKHKGIVHPAGTKVKLTPEGRMALAKDGLTLRDHDGVAIEDSTMMSASQFVLDAKRKREEKVIFPPYTEPEPDLPLGFLSRITGAIEWLTFRRAAGISILVFLAMLIGFLPPLASGYSVSASFLIMLTILASTAAIVGLVILAMYLLTPSLFTKEKK